MSIFCRHVEEQATYAMIAYEAATPGNMFWQHVQAMVSCAANVSKLLWGQNGRLAKERADMRAILNVPDTSLMRPTVMRNNFEHLDERIDRWYELPGPRIYVDGNVGPIRSAIRTDGGSESYFRNFDPTTGELSFWGDIVNIHDLARELGQVRDMASQVIADLDRHP
jgi:hypothetical protein